jgi:hypothetical protein
MLLPDLEPGELNVRLNELGDEGWEIVAVVAYQRRDYIVLKRPRDSD